MVEKIKITFLGTADQIPSETRNHSAILITFKDENILVDCGEGTQRQFRKAHLNPCKVTKILLTHWHGDHTLGIPGLLQTLASSTYNGKLEICGPKGIKFLIKGLTDLYGFHKKNKLDYEVKEVSGKFFENEDFYLEAAKMEHGIPCNAYSFVIKDKLRIDKNKIEKLKIFGPVIKDLKEKKNIVYEGKKYNWKDLTYLEKGKKISIVLDTYMNARIIPFVKNSDILVCESSFDKTLKNKAKEHLHLTSADAGNIAKKAKVGKLLLTHVGQRYENQPELLLEQARKIFKECFFVKDLDSLELN